MTYGNYTNKRTCDVCGAEVKPQQRFCTCCGEKIAEKSVPKAKPLAAQAERPAAKATSEKSAPTGNEDTKRKKIALFLAANESKLPQSHLLKIEAALNDADEATIDMLPTLSFKDPNALIAISVLFGATGADRFVLGDIGVGVLKILTLGLCGILTIIDWFTVAGRTKNANFRELTAFLAAGMQN